MTGSLELSQQLAGPDKARLTTARAVRRVPAVLMIKLPPSCALYITKGMGAIVGRGIEQQILGFGCQRLSDWMSRVLTVKTSRLELIFFSFI